LAAVNGDRYCAAMKHGTGTGHVSEHPENEKIVVEYNEVFDEHTVEVPGGASRQLIYFCPWCGERLPPSKRDQWFNELEAQGLDPLKDPVPEPYKTAAWRLRQ
jgi:hypothetical protein